jgi:hypothetical protein
MEPEPVSAAYVINPSQQTVAVGASLLLLVGSGCVKFIHHLIARQMLGENVPAATYTHKSRRAVECMSAYPPVVAR